MSGGVKKKKSGGAWKGILSLLFVFSEFYYLFFKTIFIFLVVIYRIVTIHLASADRKLNTFPDFYSSYFLGEMKYIGHQVVIVKKCSDCRHSLRIISI